MTLRVNQLKEMKLFYQKILGFRLIGEFPSAALLGFGFGSGAQVQLLGLLQRSVAAGRGGKATGHIAFIMPTPDCEMERQRLEGLGQSVDASRHEGIWKQSLCLRDPEGNQVELLCCDPALDN